MSFNKVTSAQIKAARALLGWSQQDLADHASIAISTIADFERGQRIPLAINFEAICDAFIKVGVIFKNGGVILGEGPSIEDTMKKTQLPIRWIEATALEQFAETRDGQSTIPELINKLIRASIGTEANDLLFPSGDSISQPGWDGICNVDKGNEYVPSGFSGWEIGCNKKIAPKANSDYEKRSKDPLSLNPENTTFVFVTPLRWSGKDKWIKARKTEAKWKDVRVYDVDRLVHWIELCPAVGKWLAVRIGKLIPGLIQLDEAWKEWSRSTMPAITENLILAGRDEEVERVVNWLKGNASILSVQADSTDETIAFLNAVINQHTPNYNSRCLIASTNDMARTLANSISPLIIVLESTEPGIAAFLVQQGHHVYLPFGYEMDFSSSVIRLSRTPYQAIKNHLLKEEFGKQGDLGEQKAERIAEKSAHSIVILRRLISLVPGRNLPEWVKPEHFHSAWITILLAGGWDEGENDKKNLDLEALEELSGEKYETIISYLMRWTKTLDGPIRKIGNTWKIKSPLDVWFLIAHNITSEHIRRFTSVAKKVFCTPDPRFNLKNAEEWSISILNRQSNYSKFLRLGLAQTLTLLSVFGERAKNINHTSNKVETIVRDLLYQADGNLFRSNLQSLLKLHQMLFLKLLMKVFHKMIRL